MRPIGRTDGFDIHSGLEKVGVNVNEMLLLLEDSGNLREGSIDEEGAEEYMKFGRLTPEEDERKVAQEDIAIASAHFEVVRDMVRDSLKAIVKFLFNSHELPRSNGLDIGCGATGEMAEKLLPNDIDPLTWWQCDANPSAVESVQSRDPRINPFVLSYLNLGLEKNPLNIITGLSCLDSTCNVQRAIEQIRDSLVEGGYFLHIQDVGHKNYFGLSQLASQGIQPPYGIVGYPSHPKGELATFAFMNEKKLYPSVDLFRQYLADRVREVPGMEIVFNDWLSTERIAPLGDMTYLYSNGLFFSPVINPLDMRQRTSVAVTLARKT
jgi:hypothetical protein